VVCDDIKVPGQRLSHAATLFGIGKTTSAWFIALSYAVVLNLPTLLLDADATSQSAYDWFKVAQ
jgi:Mrp family chromosome partitioning ATPase